MKAIWRSLEEKLAALSEREKAVVFILVLALIFVIWHFLVMAPQKTEQNTLNTDIEKLKTELTNLSAEQKVFAKALESDPFAEKKREIARIESQIKAFDQRLDELSIGLIAEDKLARAIYDVLDATEGLKFIGVNSFAPEGISIRNEAATPDTQEQVFSFDDSQTAEQVGLYKHRVLLEVEGNYFSILSYLKGLETLEWRFYWDAIEYQVTDYPKGRAVLEVYTLTTERGDFGA